MAIVKAILASLTVLDLAIWSYVIIQIAQFLS